MFGMAFAEDAFQKENPMERILVAMDPLQTPLFPGIHALNLAKRINARVSFLVIFPDPPAQSPPPIENENAFTVKKKVDALIEAARSEGIARWITMPPIGNYENELVNFAHENRVTLLVVESADGQGGSGEAARQLLDRLRHRMDCRIEVVNEKTKDSEKKGIVLCGTYTYRLQGNSVNILLIFVMGGFVGLLSGIFRCGGRFFDDAPADYGRHPAHRGRGV